MPRVPDFVIVGGQKCGTTAAARNMALHPDIHVFRGVTRAGQRNEIEFFNQHWEQGVPWYTSHFEGAKGLIGEKTAELLHRPVCHQRMFQVNPGFKLIVLLRCPIQRAYSQWRMASLHKGDEPYDFDCVVSRELLRLDDQGYRARFYACGESEVSCWREGYLLKGMYAEQLESLYSWFPRDRVYVGVAERIRLDMATGYAPMFEFLGFSPPATRFEEHFVGKPAPPMSPQTRARLVELYRAPNDQLRTLLGDDLPEWS